MISRRGARDPRAETLREELRGHLPPSPRATLPVAASAVLVVAAGVALLVAAFLPWQVFDGASVAGVRQGGPVGAIATLAAVLGGVLILLGGLALLRMRGGQPRFVHALALLLCPVVLGLVIDRRHIIEDASAVLRADLHLTGETGSGPGITVALVALAVALLAPLLLLRQAARAMRY